MTGPNALYTIVDVRSQTIEGTGPMPACLDIGLRSVPPGWLEKDVMHNSGMQQLFCYVVREYGCLLGPVREHNNLQLTLTHYLLYYCDCCCAVRCCCCAVDAADDDYNLFKEKLMDSGAVDAAYGTAADCAAATS